MNLDNITIYLSTNCVDITPLNDLTDFNKNFVRDLYRDEPFPIFEHSIYHLLSYLIFDYKLFTASSVSWRGVVALKEDAVVFFTPLVLEEDSFLKFINKLSDFATNYKIKIQNVSAYWVHKHEKIIKSWKIENRSREEAVYDVKLLHDLPGKDFSKLRNTKNRLLRSNVLTFKTISENNKNHLKIILQKWQKTQGYKYSKDKTDKEIFMCTKFVKFLEGEPDSVIANIGYIKDAPVSYCLMHKALSDDNWWTIYSIKGLNQHKDGGTRGVSDATYINCIERANKKGALFLNDGELGIENGSREHKLRFKPCMFLKSFDIVIS
ncbi:MAG: phosphatidylglycerol lysyltransferase domain-containing protein [Nanoarchaeota archaeon]